MSLKTRLVLAGLVLLATLGGLGILVLSSVSHSEISQVDRELRSSFPVTRSLRQSRPPAPPPAPSTTRVFSASHVSAFYIASIDQGQRTVFSTPLGVSGATPELPSTPTSASNPTIVTVASRKGSITWRALLLKRPDGSGEFLVAMPLNRVEATLVSLRLTLLVAALIVLLVAGAVGFWVMRLGLRPISEVTEVASAIAAGDRSRRVGSMKSGTEAAQLSEAFNAMLDEQLRLESRLRQFIADASHELRSPVAAIVGIADLWRRGEFRDESSSEEAMRRIGQAGDQMGRLVEELLLLARLDEGLQVSRESVDASALVRECLEEVVSVDPSRQVSAEIDDGVRLSADERSLRRAVSNVIANAVRHTPSTSAITVRLTARDDEVLIEVVDEGPGMTSSQVEHAFDRFWQASASRSRAGVGLGLSIVQGVIVAHGGSVSLESTPEQGTRVRIALPRVTSDDALGPET